ncbi:DNA adenine methylase [Candidatus Pacearchaeota archaeon]|jgi:DNA adenine methylase|nr:DNA adenine methylase [Candidatus Pacearchaeota archaeon]
MNKPIWALTPLRYIGGKSKLIKNMYQYFPKDFSEFREPFVGGGSIFLYLKQLFPDRKYWINDINQNLFSFWIILQNYDSMLKLQKDLLKIKEDLMQKSIEERKELNIKMKDTLYGIDSENTKKLVLSYERAIAYYFCNKTSFSGLEQGTYSDQAFYKNFTVSNINKFNTYNKLLKNVEITNIDYSQLLNDSIKDYDENVFFYFDPPYELNKKSSNTLYGKDGILHKSFDHQRFFSLIKTINKGKFCISYNSDSYIKERYKDYNQIELDFQYVSNCGNKGKSKKTKELLIFNY